tara:strand:- start:479 stop:793 length:315 start_codon:yes stop_codon:yes gene_type:complete
METMVSFIKDADEKLCVPVSNFLGANCSAAGRLELCFEKEDGTAGEVVVTLGTNDGDGVDSKRAFKAVANAFAGSNRAGKYVKVADSLTSEFIQRDILSCASIA